MLGLLPLTAAGAGEMDKEPIVLTGQLDRTDDGVFRLIEEESGDAVILESTKDLTEHIGRKVTVTGTWYENEDGTGTFVVSTVQRATA